MADLAAVLATSLKAAGADKDPVGTVAKRPKVARVLLLTAGGSEGSDQEGGANVRQRAFDGILVGLDRARDLALLKV
jgi:hypothetical protein